MANDNNPLNKVDNTLRSNGIGSFKENSYYYHTFDPDHGHLLFTESAVSEAKVRGDRKILMINQAVPDDDPWWKVWG